MRPAVDVVNDIDKQHKEYRDAGCPKELAYGDADIIKADRRAAKLSAVRECIECCETLGWTRDVLEARLVELEGDGE